MRKQYPSYFVIITLILIICFLANHVVLSAFCLCGPDCSNALKNNDTAKVKSLFHGHCPPGKCKGCDIKYFNKLKSFNSYRGAFEIRSLNAISVLSNLSDYSCPNIASNNLVFFDTHLTTGSLPVYLQNLSIRC